MKLQISRQILSVLELMITNITLDLWRDKMQELIINLKAELEKLENKIKKIKAQLGEIEIFIDENKDKIKGAKL